MGYAPDWNKGSMKKSGATPVKHGVVSRELFHGAKTVQKFADGGEVEYNIRGEKVGEYTGNDEIAKYRMNMTDGVGGKSLRIKDQTVAPDFEGNMAEGASSDKLGDFIKDVQAKRASKDKDEIGDLINTIKANKPKPAASAPKPSRPVAKMPDEFPEEAGDTSRNDVRDMMPEEEGAGVPSSKRASKKTTSGRPTLYYPKK